MPIIIYLVPNIISCVLASKTSTVYKAHGHLSSKLTVALHQLLKKELTTQKQKWKSLL